jgi:hypothetical protein
VPDFSDGRTVEARRDSPRTGIYPTAVGVIPGRREHCGTAAVQGPWRCPRVPGEISQEAS